jgi:hypothetical protein
VCIHQRSAHAWTLRHGPLCLISVHCTVPCIYTYLGESGVGYTECLLCTVERPAGGERHTAQELTHSESLGNRCRMTHLSRASVTQLLCARRVASARGVVHSSLQCGVLHPLEAPGDTPDHGPRLGIPRGSTQRRRGAILHDGATTAALRVPQRLEPGPR